MTSEEWERLKDRIRERLPADIDEARERARRKLDQDLNRIERALNNCLNSDVGRQRLRDERLRWREFEHWWKVRAEESSAFAAQTQQKLKDLGEYIRKHSR